MTSEGVPSTHDAILARPLPIPTQEKALGVRVGQAPNHSHRPRFQGILLAGFAVVAGLRARYDLYDESGDH